MVFISAPFPNCNVRRVITLKKVQHKDRGKRRDNNSKKERSTGFYEMEIELKSHY